MKVASISETKNRLSALLDQVRRGETFLVVDRGRPVARLSPASPGGADDPGGALARLERAGLVRRGEGSLSSIARTSPPSPVRGGDILRALLADREQDR